MGISGITSTNSISDLQALKAGSTDSRSKNIQNKITDVQQQLQKVSSEEELTVNEKTNEQKELRKEISSLNTELKQHQEQLYRSQKRELMLAKLQEDEAPGTEEKPEDGLRTKEASSDKAAEKDLPASGQQETVVSNTDDGIVILKESMNPDEPRGVDAEKEQPDETGEDIAREETKPADDDKDTDAGLSRKEMHAMVSADSSVQQANRQGTIITQTRDGIAILKGEINQDERLGINTDRKQEELEKMEEREQRATAFQSSILSEAADAMQSAAETDTEETKAAAQVNADNNAFVNALKVLQERQALQPRFYVSLDN